MTNFVIFFLFVILVDLCYFYIYSAYLLCWHIGASFTTCLGLLGGC